MIPLLEPPAVPCARPGRAGPRSTRRSDTSDPLGTLPAHGGLIRTGTADLIGLAVLERESPGQARKSRSGLNRSNRLNKAWSKTPAKRSCTDYGLRSQSRRGSSATAEPPGPKLLSFIPYQGRVMRPNGWHLSRKGADVTKSQLLMSCPPESPVWRANHTMLAGAVREH
jgi:hypothetical protein